MQLGTALANRSKQPQLLLQHNITHKAQSGCGCGGNPRQAATATAGAGAGAGGHHHTSQNVTSQLTLLLLQLPLHAKGELLELLLLLLVHWLHLLLLALGGPPLLLLCRCQHHYSPSCDVLLQLQLLPAATPLLPRPPAPVWPLPPPANAVWKAASCCCCGHPVPQALQVH